MLIYRLSERRGQVENIEVRKRKYGSQSTETGVWKPKYGNGSMETKVRKREYGNRSTVERKTHLSVPNTLLSHECAL